MIPIPNTTISVYDTKGVPHIVYTDMDIHRANIADGTHAPAVGVYPIGRLDQIKFYRHAAPQDAAGLFFCDPGGEQIDESEVQEKGGGQITCGAILLYHDTLPR